MKNVHLLPTEKPSRLVYFGSSQELTLQDNPATFRVFERSPQHIYITSNEEIKEGDWQLSNDKYTTIRTNSFHESDKKIILTTDKDLIKDGVQAIDDDFLEWFVKNPSCESVDIKLIKDSEDHPEIVGGYKEEWEYYEIIIPKEEPKPKTLNIMNEEIKKQINLLEEEQTRVKQFINENNFNCTTAPYVIAKQYRDAIKKHIKILKINLKQK